MPTYFCETKHVKRALQEAQVSFDTEPLGTDNVEAAISGASQWFAKATDGYWYDSNKTASDLIDDTAATASEILLDVPSSPHRQDGQLHRATTSTRITPKYPVRKAGPYCKVFLPVLSADSIDTLNVRERGGDMTDWVADADKDQGQGNDYYIQEDRSTAYGRSYLFIRASSIGSRRTFENLLEVSVSYGFDQQNTDWTDVRRGIAALAAANLVTEDDVLAQIPDNGQIIGLETQADRLLEQALGDRGALTPYM